MRRRNVNSHIHVDGEDSSDSSSSDNVESSGSVRSLNSRQQQDYERRLRDSYSASESEWSVNSEARVSMKQGRKEILEVISDLARKSKTNSYFADLHRGFNYVVSAVIIFGSGLVGVALAFDDYENKFVIFTVFAICFIKGIYDLFGLNQRGINYQYASHQLREKLRKSREAMMFLDNGDEMFHYAQHVREEIDEIEFNLFKTSYGPENVNLDMGIDGSPSANIANDRNG
jgi:hypothetical protein